VEPVVGVLHLDLEVIDESELTIRGLDVGLGDGDLAGGGEGAVSHDDIGLVGAEGGGGDNVHLLRARDLDVEESGERREGILRGDDAFRLGRLLWLALVMRMTTPASKRQLSTLLHKLLCLLLDPLLDRHQRQIPLGIPFTTLVPVTVRGITLVK